MSGTSAEYSVVSTDQLRPLRARVSVGPTSFPTAAVMPYERSGIVVTNASPSAAIATAGGMSAQKDVCVGQTASCVGNATAAADSASAGNVSATGSVSCASAVVGGALSCLGDVNVPGTADCTGSLRVAGNAVAAAGLTATNLLLPDADLTVDSLTTGYVTARTATATTGMTATAVHIAGDVSAASFAEVETDELAVGEMTVTCATIAEAGGGTTPSVGSTALTAGVGGLTAGGGFEGAGKVAVSGGVSVPNGGVGVGGDLVLGGAELGATNLLYRGVRAALSGDRATDAEAWSGFGLTNAGTTGVRGSAQLPACCRTGGPLELWVVIYNGGASAASVTLGVAAWMASPGEGGGGQRPQTMVARDVRVVSVPSDFSRLTIYSGTAPATSAALRGATLFYDVLRQTDATAANEVVVVSAELAYVHQSWGVTFS